jgi:glycosyltransferase involved in cell wall biosynthesis
LGEHLVRTGIVIIGRNEGERLIRCLESLADRAAACVYVDSGSTDGSVHAAAKRGVMVVELDMRIPFTAARARNAGARYLLQAHPSITYVHFIDGDCEVERGWLDVAESFLDAHPEAGVVFGLQRERFPERSVFNTLFDIEWDTPRGPVKSCAGNSLCRRELFELLHGFREDLIAGEDPEFCVRVRSTGALVWHLDVPMVRHDANMMRLGQWWKRTKRSGYAYAQGAELHGQPPESHFVRETRSVILWGLVIPAIILLLAVLVSPWWLLAVLVYPLQVLRIASQGTRSVRVNLLYGAFVMLGKFPELAGTLAYYWNRSQQGPQRPIEYK